MAGYFLSLIGMLSLNLYAVVYEDLPESARLVRVNVVELKVNGKKAAGELFYSNRNREAAMESFRALMKKQGFTLLANVKDTLVFGRDNLRNTAQFLEEKKGTAVLTCTLESEPGSSKDRGAGTPGIPGPAGSKREYCFERLSGKERSLISSYTFPGSVSSCESYYRNYMAGSGWSRVLSRNAAEGKALVFEKDSAWCHIFLFGKTALISLYTK